MPLSKMFLTEATTPAPNGSHSPLIGAARAEILKADEPPTYILYARVLAGGVDRTLEKRLGPDHWTIVGGVVAEFALIAPDGQSVFQGVYPGLHAAHGDLSEPATIRDEPVAL